MKTIRSATVLIILLNAMGFAQSWNLIPSGTSTKLYSVYFSTPDTGWIGGEGGVIRRTTNGGSAWISQTGIQNVTSIRFVNSQVGWAAAGSSGTGSIRKTTDGGNVWFTQKSGISVMWDVTPIDLNRAWAAGADGSILKTTDGGATWTAQNSGSYSELRELFFTDSLRAWAVGADGSILKTTNGGTTWSSQSSGTSSTLQDVFFINVDTGWCAGDDGVLLKTTDGGMNWGPLSSGTSSAIWGLFFTSSRDGYAVGGNGVIKRTTDGGVSWTDQASGFSRNLHAVQILENGTIWTAGDSGTVLNFSMSGPSNAIQRANPNGGTRVFDITVGDATLPFNAPQTARTARVELRTLQGQRVREETKTLSAGIYVARVVWLDARGKAVGVASKPLTRLNP